MSQENIQTYFSDDHDRLDGLFVGFQENKGNDLAKAAQLFKEFKSGLERHIRWEEEILFPIFEQKTGHHDDGPTFVMRQEHLRIKEGLGNIAQKIDAKSTATEADEAALLGVLKEHNQKEEGILYPMLDHITSEEEKREIFSKIQSSSGWHSSCCCGDET